MVIAETPTPREDATTEIVTPLPTRASLRSETLRWPLLAHVIAGPLASSFGAAAIPRPSSAKIRAVSLPIAKSRGRGRNAPTARPPWRGRKRA